MEYPSPYAPPALDEMDTVVRKYELGHMQFGGRSEVYTYACIDYSLPCRRRTGSNMICHGECSIRCDGTPFEALVDNVAHTGKRRRRAGAPKMRWPSAVGLSNAFNGVGPFLSFVTS